MMSIHGQPGFRPFSKKLAGPSLRACMINKLGTFFAPTRLSWKNHTYCICFLITQIINKSPLGSISNIISLLPAGSQIYWTLSFHGHPVSGSHQGIHPNQKPGFGFQDARMFLQQAIQNSEVGWKMREVAVVEVSQAVFLLCGWLKMDVVVKFKILMFCLLWKIIMR